MELDNNVSFLKINNEDLNLILKQKKNNMDIKKLIQDLTSTIKLTKSLILPLINGSIKGDENLEKLGKINPLHWEFGHIVYFWIENTFKRLDIPLPDILKNSYYYDSFKTDRETRFDIIKNNEIDSIKKIEKVYDTLMSMLISQLMNYVMNNLNQKESYLIYLSLLHNEMHNESFCFSLQLLGQPKPELENKFKPIYKNKNLVENSFIKIKGGEFIQGWNDEVDNFTFDNERPSFKTKVDDFLVSKYCVTNSQYLKFIFSGGYKKEEYWCPQGWRWVQKNKIEYPLYWLFDDQVGKMQRRKWDKWIIIDENEPVTNISWYEANAYCRWANCRLPTEAEWEYMATNGGKTKYPWGNEEPNNTISNLNYNYDGVVDVSNYETGNNKDGVSQLIGNVWEWCQEPIYPYNGFEIDPVYREMSYPFFGFKKICRGGAWCVPDFLINSKYRNAQMPDCRYQYIGFRIVKK